MRRLMELAGQEGLSIEPADFEPSRQNDGSKTPTRDAAA